MLKKEIHSEAYGAREREKECTYVHMFVYVHVGLSVCALLCVCVSVGVGVLAWVRECVCVCVQYHLDPFIFLCSSRTKHDTHFLLSAQKLAARIQNYFLTDFFSSCGPFYKQAAVGSYSKDPILLPRVAVMANVAHLTSRGTHRQILVPFKLLCMATHGLLWQEKGLQGAAPPKLGLRAHSSKGVKHRFDNLY